jgi:hypothetical protein
LNASVSKILGLDSDSNYQHLLYLYSDPQNTTCLGEQEEILALMQQEEEKEEILLGCDSCSLTILLKPSSS